MGSEAAPEFAYDHGIYYPVTSDYYGFYCTGNEKPSEWDDHHSFFGLDGQDVHFSGLQTENLPYVCYTPNYGYPHSSYNPYNPYIPGAVMELDGSNLGVQQYFPNQSFQQPTSSPAYVPVVVPSSTDVIPYGASDPSLMGMVPSFPGSYDNVGLTFTNPLATSMKTPSVKVPTENPSFELPKVALAKISDDPVVNVQQKIHPTIHGPVQAGNHSQTIENTHSSGLLQASNHFSRGRIPPAQNSSKANLAAKNNFVNYGSPMSSSLEKLNPKFSALSYGARFRGPNLPNELNRGPRTSRAKGQGAVITAKSYTSKLDGSSLYKSIIIDPDLYDGNNFRVDYPNAKFFVIKSYSEDDVHKSIKYNVWSSTINGNKKLDNAYLDAQNISGGEQKCPVFLFFSVNASGHFCGIAEMTGHVDFQHDMDFWQQDQWSGCFPVKWHIIKDVPNSSLRHIILENNDDRPVTHSRDTQEIAHTPGVNMLKIFKNSSLKESILDDFMYYEELEKRKHQEKVKLPRRNYSSTDLIPTFVPANVLGSRIVQPMPSDKLNPNSVSDQISGEDDTHKINGSLSETNEKNQENLSRHLEVATKQTTYALTQLLNLNNKLVDEVNQPMQVGREQQDSTTIKSDPVASQSQDVVTMLENCKVNLPWKSDGQQFSDAVLPSSTSNKNKLSVFDHSRHEDVKQASRAVSKSLKANCKTYRPVQRNDVQPNSNDVQPPSENGQTSCAVLQVPTADKKGSSGFNLANRTSKKKNDMVFRALDVVAKENNLKDAKSSATGNSNGQATKMSESQGNANSGPSRDLLAQPIAKSSSAGLSSSMTSDTVTIGSVKINIRT